MKLKITGSVLVLLLLVAGCGQAATTTGQPTTVVQVPTTTASVTPVVTPSATTLPGVEPPTTAELRAGNFAYAELPRITSEQLYLMFSKIWAVDPLNPLWRLPSDADFVMVNIGSNDMGAHINGTYKFIDPVFSSGAAIITKSLLWNLESCPKDKLLIFYDNGGDDALAGSMAQALLDLNEGYNPQNVKVLWQGLVKWQELNYPYYDPSKGPST